MADANRSWTVLNNFHRPQCTKTAGLFRLSVDNSGAHMLHASFVNHQASMDTDRASIIKLRDDLTKFLDATAPDGESNG
jgi:hypothetical protein